MKKHIASKCYLAKYVIQSLSNFTNFNYMKFLYFVNVFLTTGELFYRRSFHLISFVSVAVNFAPITFTRSPPGNRAVINSSPLHR
jgi:hypothetical protein